MDGRVILRDGQIKIGRGQPADRRHDRVGGDDPVALRDHKTDTRVEQDLLGEKNIESGALADVRLLPDSVERDLRRLDRGLRGLDHRPRGVELAPGRHHGRANDVALKIGLQAGLTQRFLGLAHARVDFASFIDRHGYLPHDRTVEETFSLDTGIVIILLNIADEVDRRVEFSLDKLDLKGSRIRLVQSGLNGGMLGQRQVYCCAKRARQQGFQ